MMVGFGPQPPRGRDGGSGGVLWISQLLCPKHDAVEFVRCFSLLEEAPVERLGDPDDRLEQKPQATFAAGGEIQSGEHSS